MRNRITRMALLMMGFALFCANPAAAQLEGHFSLEKTQVVVGEPVFLRFDLTNAGKTPLQFNVGNRYSYCGGYQIVVSDGQPLQHSSCARGFAVSCPSSKQVLAAGETRRESILVNYEHDLSRPGTYEIAATWGVRYGPETKDDPWPAGDQEGKAQEQFTIEVTPGNGEDLSPLFQPYVAGLQEKDEERRMEAARVIGSLAPPSLEDTLVAMLDIPGARGFALLGLRRVNTPRAREVLAGIVQSTLGYAYEKEQAIRYLSEMGDKRYFPLLLGIAQKQPPNQARDSVLAAARLGGDDGLPFLEGLLADTDGFSRANGIMGLGETGSRTAVPLLIEVLRDSNADFGHLALSGLRQLTHRSVFLDGEMYRVPASQQYAPWVRWWALHGAAAPVYGPGDCGEVLPAN